VQAPLLIADRESETLVKSRWLATAPALV